MALLGCPSVRELGTDYLWHPELASAPAAAGNIADIVVNPAAIDHFTVTGIADPVVAGVLSSPVVTAYDVYDNVKTDYVGTIHFTSTDVKGTTLLPDDYTFDGSTGCIANLFRFCFLKISLKY